jgi:hypothetical protein
MSEQNDVHGGEVEQLARRVAELERRLAVSRIYSDSFLARAFAIGWHTLAAYVIFFVLTVMPIRILVDLRASHEAEPRMSTNADSEEQFVATFVRRHSSWMHEQDSKGNAIRHPRTGRPLFTPNGKRLIQYMDEAEAKGIRRFEEQVNYALQKLSGEGVVIPRTEAGSHEAVEIEPQACGASQEDSVMLSRLACLVADFLKSEDGRTTVGRMRMFTSLSATMSASSDAP